ncbi:MAG TPA: glucose-6-phosphate dehydrogenase [Thermoanaerobaculia bacterium]|nr:glucose-6-phosphate dehydrogenase [Thermoanaerobaculia bacterium]
MPEAAKVFPSTGLELQPGTPKSEPCVMVIFGASGDLTKRLLVPALYNLECDGLLPDNFAVLGVAPAEMDDEGFREAMFGASGHLREFHTRKEFDEQAAGRLRRRFHFEPAAISVDDYRRVRGRIAAIDAAFGTGGNMLLYLAMPPRFFGLLCETLHEAGFQEGEGWKRIIVEKPFGTDLESARQLNAEILRHWREDDIYRVDHYLGKETVQNLLAFRFSNGMFEPLWNRSYIDNIQFNVCESVDVGGRAAYYDTAGVLRDMMQNHMFQMLAYLCMEPPASFRADAIRNEKAKLLESVRIYAPEEVERNAVRGQYGPAIDDDGEIVKPGYRQERGVDPASNTETFAALRLFIDNWRWEGVPFYLRSGKALWKRGTEIVVEFKKAPEAIFRGTPVERLEPNRLVFHIQPFQGIELLFHAKTPGPVLQLQEVDMRFSYGDAFRASRYTGYEVMIYSCTRGDATLFSRGDLVEAAWRIAQPILDAWRARPAGDEFPNYMRSSWGPPAASDLIECDGRRWFEVVTPEVLERAPLFAGADPILLHSVIMALHASTVEAGETIIQIGDPAQEMYLISRGQVDVINKGGTTIRTLKDGDFFGEIGLLMTTQRTATVRARTQCDLFVLRKDDFLRILRDHPRFAEATIAAARERYNVDLHPE